MSKVFIVDTGAQYEQMFKARGWEVTRDLLAADLVQFTGGADVSPYLYGEEKHPTTYNDPRRDLVESGYYQVSLLLKKPMAGICRGGQFLNVMNYGKMFQNVNGHAISGTHEAEVVYRTDGKGEGIEEPFIYQVTSTHHQMMRPHADGKVLLIAERATRLETDTLVFEGSGEDCEAVFYEKTKSLCFQPHPEFCPTEHECQVLYFKFLERYLGV